MDKLLLFASGIFFGGAIDHFLLLLMGSGQTPYGLDVGVRGNAALAVVDLAISVTFYWSSRRFGRR